jgi:hypothetical protein
MLNIAGPEFDFSHVVYAVLQECEHRRRGLEYGEFEAGLEQCVQEKLEQVKAAYDEFSGSKTYWQALEKEVLETVLPQYTQEALEITQMERASWHVFRGGDLAGRLMFALFGLVIGGLIIAAPFIPIFEETFAFVLTAGGFFYPDLKRFYYERAYTKRLNRMVTESARYQETARLQYMTREQIQESFAPGGREEEREEEERLREPEGP